MTTREPDDPRFSPIMLRKELIEIGWKDKTIADAVADGSLHKLRYGTYVDASAWKRLDEVGRHEMLTRGVLKRSCTEMVPSHISALPFHDVPIWDLPLDWVHGTRLDAKAGRVASGVHQHAGELRPQDLCVRHGVTVVSATRAALDLTTVADVEHALGPVNHLLHVGATTQKLLAEGAVFMRDWPYTLTTDLVLRLADPRIETLAESRTWCMCFKQSLPMPEPQFEVYDAGRLVARLDFAWPEHGVWLEFDGRVKYQELLKPGQSATDVVLLEKGRERMVAELTGWRCIRITWADLMFPDRTAAKIRAFLYPARRAG